MDHPIPLVPTVSRDTLAMIAPPLNEWPIWQKRSPVSAIRVAGPFRVLTSNSEQPFFCADGYLAIDARGYPYAIDADEFAMIYERLWDSAPEHETIHSNVTAGVKGLGEAWEGAPPQPGSKPWSADPPPGSQPGPPPVTLDAYGAATLLNAIAACAERNVLPSPQAKGAAIEVLRRLDFLSGPQEAS